jgi:hypothetical protein
VVDERHGRPTAEPQTTRRSERSARGSEQALLDDDLPVAISPLREKRGARVARPALWALAAALVALGGAVWWFSAIAPELEVVRVSGKSSLVRGATLSAEPAPADLQASRADTLELEVDLPASAAQMPFVYLRAEWGDVVREASAELPAVARADLGEGWTEAATGDFARSDAADIQWRAAQVKLSLPLRHAPTAAQTATVWLLVAAQPLSADALAAARNGASVRAQSGTPSLPVVVAQQTVRLRAE